jgi:Na+/H+ antiporter NhaD/arsenite permease-like protein
MDQTFLIPAIFALTYVVIAIQKIPGIQIDRPSGVMVGSTLLVLTGLVGLHEAYTFIDPDVMLFLLGMMIQIAYLEHAGFFEWVAGELARRASTAAGLLAATLLASALLSAFFVNDTICLLFTPILLRAARQLRLNPVPYLIAIAMGANFGSALTITGNPQNMYIGIQSGLPFLRFMAVMAVPVAFALGLTYAALRLGYRAEITRAPLTRGPREVIARDPVLIAKTLATMAVTLGLFIAGAGYPLSALVGASLIVVIGRVKPREAFTRIDWNVLLFFAGLFVVMGAFAKAGYVSTLLGWVEPMLAAAGPRGLWGSAALLSAVTVVFSNLVSNVPAVILLQPLVRHLGGGDALWLLLALASTFAGNLTLVGSVANLIVAEQSSAQGVTLGFWAYLKVGLPVTILAAAAGTLWLSWF